MFSQHFDAFVCFRDVLLRIFFLAEYKTLKTVIILRFSRLIINSVFNFTAEDLQIEYELYRANYSKQS